MSAGPNPPATAAPAAIPWRDIVLLAALAVGLRAALLGWFFHDPQHTWAGFLTHSDANSFLRMARVLVLGEPAAQLSFYDRRIFPGWPLLFGGALPILPAPVAMIGATLAATAALPGLILVLTRSFATAATVAVLPPVWLNASTHPMAEPAFLLCAVSALAAVHGRAWLVAGALGGLACTIKPYGLFLALGLAWAASRSPSPRLALVRLLGAALVPVIAAAGISWFRLGQPAPQFQVYASALDQLNIHPDAARLLGGASGHWDWPLKALVLTPLRVAVPTWKLLYVYGHAAAAVFFVMRALRRRSTQNSAWEQACLIWLIGNTAASFCAGPYWGFHAFDRYVVWAWPAAAILNRDLFTRTGWLVALPFSFAASAYSILGR